MCLFFIQTIWSGHSRLKLPHDWISHIIFTYTGRHQTFSIASKHLFFDLRLSIFLIRLFSLPFWLLLVSLNGGDSLVLYKIPKCSLHCDIVWPVGKPLCRGSVCGRCSVCSFSVTTVSMKSTIASQQSGYPSLGDTKSPGSNGPILRIRPLLIPSNASQRIGIWIVSWPRSSQQVRLG